MSHQVETIAYAHKAGSKDAAYQVPWHGLGTPVSNKLSAEEMQVAAGLDWEVKRYPQFIKFNGKNILSGEDALVRESDGRILTHISENWEFIQNSEAFDFFTKFVKEGHMEMNTAGSLRDGQLVWVLAKIKKSFTVGKGKKDLIENYLLFTLPHQYGKSIDIRNTPIRAVCNNTVTLALAGKNDLMVKVSHRQKFDPDLVKETMGLADDKFGQYQEMAEFLAARKFKKALLGKFFNDVFPSNSKKDDEKVSRPARLCLESMDTQPGHELGEGTWWQAVNAVTYNIDHVLGHSADTRLQSSWYGINRKKKLFALEKAVEYANS